MLKKKEDPKRAHYNRIGIIVSCIYMVFTLAFKGISHSQIKDALISQKIDFIRLETKPTPLNALLWCGYAETKDSFKLGYYSLMAPSKPVVFYSFPKKHEIIGKFEGEEIVKRLIRLSRGWFNIEKEGENFYFYDLRFGQIGFNEDPNSFVFKYELFMENGNLRAKQKQRSIDGIGKALKILFHRIIYNE